MRGYRLLPVLFPVVAISLFLTGRGEFVAIASPAPRTRPTARTTTALPRLSSCQAWPCLFLLDG